MKARLIIILVILFQTEIILNAQTNIIEQRIEQIAESAENDELDFNTLFETLTIYYESPLNLNTASREQLESMSLLSNFQIAAFIEYRDTYGSLLSIYELAAIDSWDMEIINTVLPFVTVSPDLSRQKITLERVLKYGKNEFLTRWQSTLETPEGYQPISEEELRDSPNARYLGSRDKFYARYRYQYQKNISFGVTAEKDAGEEFFSGTQKNGFDFYSAHLYVRDIGRVKALALGDYQAQFGQGLTFWSGLGFNRKSSFTVSTAQSAPGIGAYTSVNENLFLRGGAATINFGKFDFTAFYSDKKIDANLLENENDTSSTLDADPIILVSSFQESGFHRTENEIADKHALPQRHIGGNVSYGTDKLQLGITAVQMDISGAIEPRQAPYSQFRLNDNSNTVVGFDYQFNIRNFFFFGETSRSANGGMATMNGLNIAMNARLSFNVLQRKYDTDFQAIASSAFGEGSTVENESGVYYGLELRPFKKFLVNAYIDHFRFPWLRYLTDAPSHGYDFFTQVEYNPNGRTNIYVRYRHREKQMNTRDSDAPISFLVNTPRNNLRINYTFRASSSIRLRTRLEFTDYQRDPEPVQKGFMIYQDITYSPEKIPLSLSLRYALFDTDSYDTRIYAYENDILYAFSIPAYSGRGARIYATLRYRFNRNLDVWLRYGQFYYTDRDIVGTGKEEIMGRTKTELKAQVRYRF